MKLTGKRSTIILIGFVICLVVFAYGLLTYTRRVDGVSMRPTLEEGDLVVIAKVPFNSLHVGDVIVYTGPCSAVLYNGVPASVIHRIINISSQGLTTKGDNNPGSDQSEGIAQSPITAACIEGKVVLVVPYIERLASLPDGLNYILAVIIILGVVMYELWGRGVVGSSPAGGTAQDDQRLPAPAPEPTTSESCPAL